MFWDLIDILIIFHVRWENLNYTKDYNYLCNNPVTYSGILYNTLAHSFANLFQESNDLENPSDLWFVPGSFDLEANAQPTVPFIDKIFDFFCYEF